MSNHDHAIFRTPAANLVEGMKRFQNAYTRRIMNQRDSAAGRRRWVESLDGRIRSEQGTRDIDGVSFGTRAQRGWYWGSEAFREKLMTRVDSKSLGANPNDRRGAMGQDRREKDGERIIGAAQRHYGVALNELRANAYGDQRRASVAWRLARETPLPQSWIAERLDLKTPSNVSRIVGRFSKLPNRSLPKAVREWKTLKIID